MFQGPKKAIKTYVCHSFEKSINNIVTYLSKIWSKSRFPEGGAETATPPIANRVKKVFCHILKFHMMNIYNLIVVYDQ